MNISSAERAKQRREEAIKYLSLVPQRDAFVAGNMPVILPEPHDSRKETARAKEDVETTMRALGAEQRPRTLFVSSPKEIAMAANGIDILATKADWDGLEGFPCAIDLDTHYFLNTKAALCTSGLPSPKSELIEVGSFSADAKDCCSSCVSHADELCIPEDCTGIRRPWLRDRISNVLDRVTAQPIPFVLKTQQGFGGAGTIAVSSSKELSELKARLSTLILPKLLSSVVTRNAYLNPATLVLSEMVTDIIGNWGLTFFVTKAGACVFLAATQQIMDSEEKAWLGSKISYLAQEKLKKKFTLIMEEIGAWLHGHGYFGPCGADILEAINSDDPARTSTSMYIVDLNVRTSGSLVLGLLKGHFSVRRNLHEATALSVTTKMTRGSFVRELNDEYRDGRLIIVSWSRDVKSNLSYGFVIVGALNAEALEREVAKIKRHASTTEM
ncbi:MAG: hypothetical protein Q9208_002701 [Pyrenodesmia sp. 3 TL-2023]